jgi:flagellar hook-associated protein 3 FlgL
MSSAFRITQGTVNTTVMANLQQNLTRMQALQEHLSSGKQISRPSDSPAGTGSALQVRSDIRRTEQYTRNAQDGLGWLGVADDTLTTSINMVRRARELVAGAASASMGGPERQAMAREVDALRDSLVGLANASYLNRPVFAGTANVPRAYAPDGTYLGNTGPAAVVERTVAPGVSVQVNLVGEDVFGAGGASPGLFATLKAISQHLDANDQNALLGDLDKLDASQQLIQDNLSKVGALYNRVETMRDRADNTVLTLRNSLSDVEDIDLPKTIVDLQLQETAYKAALSATARVIQPSLVEFLR